MTTKTRKGKTATGKRWTVTEAAAEWGIHRETLSARIKTTGIVAGPDKNFSTRQIDAAIHGDIDGERLRETRAKADGLELENARKRGEVVYVADFVKEYHRALIAIKQTIMNSKLKETEKNELLSTLSAIQTEVDEEPAKGKAKP